MREERGEREKGGLHRGRKNLSFQPEYTNVHLLTKYGQTGSCHSNSSQVVHPTGVSPLVTLVNITND